MSVLLILFYFLLGCEKETIEVVDPVEVPVVANIGGQRYVSPVGDDMNPGTYEKPWATWQRAFDMASPGDTIYIRGGVYYATRTVRFDPVDRGSNNGTENSPVHFFNYPGETPILDGSKKVEPSSGVAITRAEHLHLRGLTMRNNFQIRENESTSNIVVYKSSNIILENCTSHNSGRRGFHINTSDEIYVLNCDSYNNADSLWSGYAGGGGDGFLVWDDGKPDDVGKKVVLRNCRAWNNSDDGYDIETEGLIVVEGCWAIGNGYLDGDGMGFKFGLKDVQTEGVTKILTNCVSAFNTVNGYTTNDRNRVTNAMHIYNNVAYANGNAGYVIFATDESESRELERIFRNNVSYGNGRAIWSANAGYTHSHNSWDSNLQLSDGDFLSLDPSDITGNRLADGSLVELPFLRLTENSDLIDAGINVGLPHEGKAPDLGPWEFK